MLFPYLCYCEVSAKSNRLVWKGQEGLLQYIEMLYLFDNSYTKKELEPNSLLTRAEPSNEP